MNEWNFTLTLVSSTVEPRASSYCLQSSVILTHKQTPSHHNENTAVILTHTHTHTRSAIIHLKLPITDALAFCRF